MPMIETTLSAEALGPVMERLRAANGRFAARFPGERGERQPVHTVYGGAHLFKADTAQKLGGVALRALDEHAPDFAILARALGLPGAASLPASEADTKALAEALRADPAAVRRTSPAAWLAHTVRARVVEKLQREPVEDLRIDFEDGYGVRAPDEEDAHAVTAARELAKGLAARSLPPFIGIRIKAFTEELRARSVRTLDVFLSTLCAETGGVVPPGFVVTLPKVVMAEQVAALAEILAALEASLGLPARSLGLELMIETTQSIVDARGAFALPGLSDAAGGRCVAAHFGPYDYTASCDITAAHQGLTHPAAHFARQMMKVAFAGTGVRLSDGPTTALPIPPHRPRPGGPALSAAEIADNRAAVHRAWRLAFENVTRALVDGYYQGWDLHPAQLPVRYAAVYAFFLEGLEPAAARLRNFVERAAQATRSGDVFDDAATGQGLLNYFIRAVNAGALTEDEAVAAAGLTLAELRARSFSAIVDARKA